MRPGEVTLAHGGVLFLDELPEFRRDVIESLRVTMEHGVAVVTRTRGRVSMPARPLIVAAMNPCPCGYAGDSRRLCGCPPDRVARYAGRISGPVLDRFDLYVRVPRVDPRKLRGEDVGESSDAVRARVVRARERLAREGAMPPLAIARSLDASASKLLDAASDRLGLSARGHAKVLRIARTIAALEGAERVVSAHLAEALGYRGPSGRDRRSEHEHEREHEHEHEHEHEREHERGHGHGRGHERERTAERSHGGARLRPREHVRRTRWVRSGRTS